MVNQTIHSLRQINPEGFIVKFLSLTAEAQGVLSRASPAVIDNHLTRHKLLEKKPAQVGFQGDWVTINHRNGRDVVEMPDERFCQPSLPLELAQHTPPAFLPKVQHFPRQGFKVKQLHSSAIHLFLPYMSFTANVSAEGDISPPEPNFMKRNCPLYK